MSCENPHPHCWFAYTHTTQHTASYKQRCAYPYIALHTQTLDPFTSTCESQKQIYFKKFLFSLRWFWTICVTWFSYGNMDSKWIFDVYTNEINFQALHCFARTYYIAWASVCLYICVFNSYLFFYLFIFCVLLRS